MEQAVDEELGILLFKNMENGNDNNGLVPITDFDQSLLIIESFADFNFTIQFPKPAPPPPPATIPFSFNDKVEEVEGVFLTTTVGELRALIAERIQVPLNEVYLAKKSADIVMKLLRSHDIFPLAKFFKEETPILVMRSAALNCQQSITLLTSLLQTPFNGIVCV